MLEDIALIYLWSLILVMATQILLIIKNPTENTRMAVVFLIASPLVPILFCSALPVLFWISLDEIWKSLTRHESLMR